MSGTHIFFDRENRNAVMNVRDASYAKLTLIDSNRLSFALSVLLVHESLHRSFPSRIVKVLMLDIWFLRFQALDNSNTCSRDATDRPRAVRGFNFISRDCVDAIANHREFSVARLRIFVQFSCGNSHVLANFCNILDSWKRK